MLMVTVVLISDLGLIMLLAGGEAESVGGRNKVGSRSSESHD